MNIFLQSRHVSDINAAILEWYTKNRRSLPFRESKEPYQIWISEIMAQQTQITTLLPYYERFISAFPTVHDLASADLEDVYSVWEGLGYYSRAANIKRAAEIIDRDGFPVTYNALLKLPGIGPYTAGAIASIAYDEKVPAIDGNVIRVLSRIFEIEEDLNLTKNKKRLFRELVETMPDESGTYNQALMELGALVCTPKSPSCLLCPVRSFCRAFELGRVEDLPIKKRKVKKRVERNDALIMLYKNKPLFVKRESGLLSGLYGFPIKDVEDGGIKVLAHDYGVETLEKIGHSKHVFTHVIWETDVYTADISRVPDGLRTEPSGVATAFKKMSALLSCNR